MKRILRLSYFIPEKSKVKKMKDNKIKTSQTQPKIKHHQLLKNSQPITENNGIKSPSKKLIN